MSPEAESPSKKVHSEWYYDEPRIGEVIKVDHTFPGRDDQPLAVDENLLNRHFLKSPTQDIGEEQPK